MGEYLYLFGGPRLLRLRLFWLRLRWFGLLFRLRLGLRPFLGGFRLFVQWWIANDISQDIGQRDDAEQTPLPSTAPFILFSLNYDQPMHPAFVDQLEKCSKGVRRGADDNTREVWGAFVKRLTDR